jgi:mono/diheme cytochrome c family protein
MTWNGRFPCRLARFGQIPLFAVALVVAANARGAGVENGLDGASGSDKADPAAVEFFEKKVRPILSARCQGCHGPDKQKGGLRLDTRAAVLAGGLTGPVIVPGNPKESPLVDAINYGETRQMPPKSKLSSEEIAALTEWVERGAPWGVDTGRTSIRGEAAKEAGKPGQLSSEEFQKRARFWCFQPIKHVVPPAASGGWARNPIDRFIQAAHAEHGLSPAPEADRRTLIRRLSFDLIGLPPAPQDVAAFLADDSLDAYERLVDRLLARPQYGERWARHWLDLVRYAETTGHEFDYDIVNAYRYRDYVIRAFNADLPYNQFVVEHIAGDLIDSPRRHRDLGYNESILATGFYFLGEGTHSPVDVREDQMRRIDNQIDVISKTFLGLTVACARCHDHKFDPIRSQDYYALAGFLASSRFQYALVDPEERIAPCTRRLRQIKQAITKILCAGTAPLPDSMRRQLATVTAECSTQTRVDKERASGARPIAARSAERVFEDFNRDHFDGWFVTGDAFGDGPSRAGDFHVDTTRPRPHLLPVKPGMAHSGLLSSRLQGVLRSRTFTIETRYIHWLVAGRGARISVVVDGYEKIRDPIYGGLTTIIGTSDQFGWATFDVGMWMGHSAYLEIADGAAVNFNGATTALDNGRGYIAVDEIRMSSEPEPTPTPPIGAGQSVAANVDLRAVIAFWQKSRPDLVRELTAALDELQLTEARIPDPNLALAIADGTGTDERIHIRGSHKNLGEVAPRRFPELLGGSVSSAGTTGSGRLELALRMVDPAANPLLARVLVNRLWKHHFGNGIVRSTDDFGAMGQKPTHPDLLDWLAGELGARGWSIKAMHRLMVTSSTYRMSSNAAPERDRLDPTNLYLHRMNVRRLEAEAIRDAILSVSGRLESVMYGPSVPVHLTSFMDGRGRPARSGPIDGDGRRTLYLNVRRNFLNPMLLAFDSPVPFSTMGRRNVSNVPAQALTLMNDPMIAGQAQLWAKRVLAVADRSDRSRLDLLYETALGRPARVARRPR